jgi:glycosyltransferase involved in cell wall biosynthesis
MNRPILKKQKLLVLQTHPIQYYAPIYQTLVQRDKIDVVVIYLTDAGAKTHFDPGFNREVKWDIDLLAGYRYRVLQPDSSLNNRSFWKKYDTILTKLISEEVPDWILLYGYSSRMNWVTWWHAQKHGIKLLYTSDSNGRIEATKSKLHAYIKKSIVSRFFKSINYFLSPSDANREYLIRYGAPQAKIIWSPFAIEVTRFNNDNKNTERPFSFVWAGKLIELKCCEDYLIALTVLRKEGLNFRALLVGDGPLYGALSPLAKSLQSTNHLERHRFINQSAMPKFLASAEILVFTSEKDAYGLIATEAAASGCALVVADKIGCVGSSGSAQPDINTLIYPCRDISKLVNCMRSLLLDKNKLKTMQTASIEISLQHDVQCSANIIENTIYGILK